MALLQISEPGQSPNPHQRRIGVGIDLGTTHSLVAAVRHGVSECLPDEAGRVLLPSAVRYLEGTSRQIGWQALEQASADPENTLVSVKRLMGRSFADIDQSQLKLPYTLIDQPGMVAVQTRQGPKSPVEVSAEILASLRQRAEDTFNADIDGAVITVPAYFDDAQRQATKDAAQLAGLNVLRLVNEPTAAAIAYGLDQGAEGVYAVYDLGGGTFDISILRLNAGVFEVLATGGDSALGGDDYDRALAQWAMRQVAVAPSTLDAGARSRLLKEARRVKEALSSVAAGMPALRLAVPQGEGALLVDVTPKDFEAITRDLTDRTLRAVKRAVRDAGVSAEELQGVVMVGGSTRMPTVRQAVGQLLNQEPLVNLNPDEVVALGAAIQANQLVGNTPEGDGLLLLDVTPLSLGLETMGGLVERIVPRNSTLPVARAQDFTTYKDGQTALALHVVQGERDMVKDCRSLARFELRGIPPMAAGAARIRVTFTVDADGLLSVSAQEQSTGIAAHIEVKPSYGLSDDELARMLQDSMNTAQEDMMARALAEAKLDAKRLIMATQSALQADGDLLDAELRRQIDQGIARLSALEFSGDAASIEAATQALAEATEPFAAMRMNRGIAQALKGHNVESL